MRGRVTFTAAGAEHCLRFTTNRLCELETVSGRSIVDYAEALGKPGAVTFSDVRVLMRAGLETASDLNAVGEIIDDIGFQAAMGLIAQAFGAAFAAPDTKGAAAPGKLTAVKA